MHLNSFMNWSCNNNIWSKNSSLKKTQKEEANSLGSSISSKCLLSGRAKILRLYPDLGFHGMCLPLFCQKKTKMLCCRWHLSRGENRLWVWGKGRQESRWYNDLQLSTTATPGQSHKYMAADPLKKENETAEHGRTALDPGI